MNVNDVQSLNAVAHQKFSRVSSQMAYGEDAIACDSSGIIHVNMRIIAWLVCHLCQRQQPV